MGLRKYIENLVAEDLTVEDLTAEDLTAEEAQLGERIYTAADDNELDDVLSNASEGDVVILTSTGYGSRTVSSGATITALSKSPTNLISGDWTVTKGGSQIKNFRVGNQTLTVEGQYAMINAIDLNSSGEIVVDANDVVVNTVTGLGKITFSSGTSNGVAGTIASRVDVVDNGSNTI